MTSPESTDRILSEQVRLLYAQLSLGAVASLITAAILCLLFWRVQPAGVLAAWYALVVVVNLPRFLLVRSYRHRVDAAAPAGPWVRRILISNLASGAMWGGGAYLLFPDASLPHQVFLAFILAGMTAGAVPLYSALRSAYAMYMLPALVPFASRLVAGGTGLQTYMAMLVLFYALVLLLSSRHINATILESLKLRFANDRLLDTLNTARQELETGNVRLQRNVAEIEAAEQAARRSNALLNAISRAQMRFIRKPNLQELFDELLASLLELTASEYGFIGQVLRETDGTPYLKTYVLTNISWNDETRAFYAQHAPQGLEFRNLQTLFGAVMTSGEPVISNAPAKDPRAGGLPKGHPPLDAFLGIPFFHGGEMIGMVGISNRPGGYDLSIVEELAPFLHTCAGIIHGERASASQHAAEASLRETAAELRGIHAHIGEGIATLDLDGRIVTANPAAERMFGIASDALKDMPLVRLLKSHERNRWMALFRDFPLGAQTVVTVELQALRADMITEFPIEIRLSHMQVAEVNRVIAVLRDVTERKEVERLKNEFIATVSHELRTPLTSIRGALGLLAGGVPGGLTEQGMELMRIAVKNSERLGRLIDDLLDMEKIEAGGVQFRCASVDVSRALKDAVQASQGYAAHLGIQVELQDPEPGLTVWADADRVMQVLANLLSNAVKFSPAGGRVQVMASPARDHVRISVQDHGRGIPEEFQDRVFEKFTQADASDTRAVGGTGLGLSISKAIIERMHGRIGFVSTPGRGTIFHFELPAQRPPGD